MPLSAVAAGALCFITMISCVPADSFISQTGVERDVVAARTRNGKCNYDIDEKALIHQGYYKKVFEDNFNTNLHNWKIWTGGAYNQELQYYQSSNLKVQNGKLVITARKETVKGATVPSNPQLKTFNYTSGRIESKTYFTPTKSFSKVRISARIKLPSGYGMWPAFWTYNDPWPTKGEIDIIEAQGQYPFQYTTNYFYGSQPNIPQTDATKITSLITSNVSLTKCYHVYEVIWTKQSLIYLLDGKIINKKSASTPANKYIPSLFGKLQRITLNVAVGGNYFVNLDPSKIHPDAMYVDWIKVFT
ncbi:unnamed protein product [Didymodactylos carnosus]|uniref:GH16 domain-containing protein n=1 Tax=Didymodactylos carnosus TaxID=1234261 RepID=A0A814GYQ4_9BILA|nr:unnamed protein product [Didymodactylos carnosus]CAF1003264.1 unnamed protein product [Didymodactylos carnosus]CAF3721172.1 unnamed protein product [Didymodactylos carnosus]CAF3774674.1 unnamed protein product [Didymodactylos carnosus]